MTGDAGTAIVRTYRRGGLFRAVLPDAFLGTGRARAEVAALERLAPLGLSPAVLGLEVSGRLARRMRIAVAEVTGARDLLRIAEQDAGALAESEVGRRVGRAVARMHDAGVAHADLNVTNVLLDPSSRVTLIDLDGASVGTVPVPAPRRVRDVLRLCRSLGKWAVTGTAPAKVRAAFLDAALPEEARLSVLRRSARAHRWRELLGRTGRDRRG